MNPTGQAKPKVTPIALSSVAASIAPAWSSRRLANVGGAQVKLIRMDATSFPAEAHLSDELLVVLEGRMQLHMDGKLVSVGAGEALLVPAGLHHGVAPGSFGVLVSIIARSAVRDHAARSRWKCTKRR